MPRPHSSKSGFTLIEIMIVVLIIGVLVAVAVPNFVRSRELARQKTCISNLKQLDSGKEQWANENRKAATDTVTMADICGPSAFIRSIPICPSGGTYSVTTVAANPTCSKTAAPDLHVLP